MSQENVEVVQAIYAAWGAGDFSSVDWAHAEIEFEFADGPTPGAWTGRAAMAKAWSETMSAFEELHAIAEEYCGLDDERVLVLMHNSGRGKESGLDVGLIPTREPTCSTSATARCAPARPLLGPRQGPRSRGAAGVATHDSPPPKPEANSGSR